jgi:hypothetical protein
MISDVERETVTLRLLDGTIHTTDTTAGASYQTDFRSYDVNLDLRATLADARHTDDPKELTIDQLQSAIAAKRRNGKPVTAELVEYHRKFAIPFACVVFGLIAMPLGIQPARAVRRAASLRAGRSSPTTCCCRRSGFAEQPRAARARPGCRTWSSARSACVPASGGTRAAARVGDLGRPTALAATLLRGAGRDARTALPPDPSRPWSARCCGRRS